MATKNNARPTNVREAREFLAQFGVQFRSSTDASWEADWPVIAQQVGQGEIHLVNFNKKHFIKKAVPARWTGNYVGQQLLALGLARMMLGQHGPIGRFDYVGGERILSVLSEDPDGGVSTETLEWSEATNTFGEIPWVAKWRNSLFAGNLNGGPSQILKRATLMTLRNEKWCWLTRTWDAKFGIWIDEQIQVWRREPEEEWSFGNMIVIDKGWGQSKMSSGVALAFAHDLFNKITRGTVYTQGVRAGELIDADLMSPAVHTEFVKPETQIVFRQAVAGNDAAKATLREVFQPYMDADETGKAFINTSALKYRVIASPLTATLYGSGNAIMLLDAPEDAPLHLEAKLQAAGHRAQNDKLGWYKAEQGLANGELKPVFPM